MTDAKPPVQFFDWATELSDAQGHVTLSEQEAHEIGARLRSMHAELETLRAGYDAARLEIESLRAALATPQPSPASQGDALDAACQRACMELPEGMSMAIQLERHAGWIELHDSDGEQIELPNADGSLAERMHEAIDAARAAQEDKSHGLKT